MLCVPLLTTALSNKYKKTVNKYRVLKQFSKSIMAIQHLSLCVVADVLRMMSSARETSQLQPPVKFWLQDNEQSKRTLVKYCA
jgi:hypothetical protein